VDGAADGVEALAGPLAVADGDTRADGDAGLVDLAVSGADASGADVGGVVRYLGQVPDLASRRGLKNRPKIGRLRRERSLVNQSSALYHCDCFSDTVTKFQSPKCKAPKS
jgi:hypothetical protein